MFAAFVTSFKFEPVALATRRIFPLVWPWPFFSLGWVDFGSESSWVFLGGIVGRRGARMGERDCETVAVLVRVADEGANFEQPSSKSSSSQSPKVSRESREWIHSEISARPRNRCLPRLQRWSQYRRLVASGVRPNLMCAQGVQGYKKPSHPLIGFLGSASPSTSQSAGHRPAHKERVLAGPAAQVVQ